MAHLALYRKYRSQTFGDLVGQSHVVRTLQNGLLQGRIAHSYLFTGPRGTGKTSTARLLAKALNCEKGPAAEPCNACESCLGIANGSSMDVLEMDAASESGVDQVREAIVHASEYRPTFSRYRVFIIDEVHDLSAKAFDALLKTIEEPPEHAIFILATTEYNKVPATIRSRCQRFEFHRGTIGNLIERLGHVVKEEGVEAEPAALNAIARMADGGYRDALTLLEQAILTSDGVLTLAHVYDQLGLMNDDAVDSMLLAMVRGQGDAVVRGLDEAYRRGRDPRSVVESMIARLAELTRARFGLDGGGDQAVEAAMRSTAMDLGEQLLPLRSALSDIHRAIRDISLPRLWLESELLRLSAPQALATKPTSVAPPSKPAPTPRPSAAPQPSSTPEEAKHGVAWGKVVDELGNLSKTARMRLAGSAYKGTEKGQAVIVFSQQIHADWATQTTKVFEAIVQAWRKHNPGAPPLRFVGEDKPIEAPGVVEATVESPLVGDQLREQVLKTFESK